MPGEYAEVNGTWLYYEVAGSGPPVVFVHGFTLDTRMWDAQFDEFAKNYRVVRYDVRGFGKSDPVGDKPLSHSDDLKALLDHLGIESASLIGLSMGGAIIIHFALKYPGAITSLVPVDSPLPGGARMPEFSAELAAIGRTAKDQGREAAIDRWLHCLLFEAENEKPAVAADLARIVGDYSAEHWLHDVNQASPGLDPVSKVGEIEKPVLVVVGERDLSMFHDHADLMLKHIAGAEKFIIPGAGHMSNMCDPELFNRRVLEFLEKVHA